MARLPSHTQSILTTSKDTLLNLAQMADKISEIEQTRVYAATSTPRTDDIASVIQKLTLEVAELKNSITHHSRPHRPRSRTPAHRPHRSTSRSSNSGSTICWCHRVFKDKAKKCCNPCEYFRTSSPAENPTPWQ